VWLDVMLLLLLLCVCVASAPAAQHAVGPRPLRHHPCPSAPAASIWH